MTTFATFVRRVRGVALLGVAGGLAVGTALYFILPRREAIDLAFVIDADRSNPMSGAAALVGLVGDAGDRSFSPEFYAYLVTSEEILYRVACRIEPKGSDCEHGEFDRMAYSRSVGILRKRVSATVTRATGVVGVRVIADDDTAAIAIGEALLATLDSYHRAIRRSRAGEELRVATRLRDSVRAELDTAEERVRLFHENNRGASGAAPRLQLELQRLQRRLDLASSVFLSLARDAQEAELRRSRDTPVMTVLQRPRLPSKRLSPPRLLRLLLAMAIIGAASTVVYVAGRSRLQTLLASLGQAGVRATPLDGR